MVFLEKNWKYNYSKFVSKHKNWLQVELFKKNSAKGPKRKPYIECKRTTKYYRQKHVLDQLEQNSPQATNDAVRKYVDSNLPDFKSSKNLNLSLEDSFEYMNFMKFSKLDHKKIEQF